MSKYGKQHHYCPNCGLHIYDDKLGWARIQPMMCSDECREQWEQKYADMALGRNAPETE